MAVFSFADGKKTIKIPLENKGDKRVNDEATTVNRH